MTIDNTNTIWPDLIALNEHHTLSFEELIALSGLSQSELHQLVENGVLIPEHLIETSLNNTNINTWHFSSHHLVSIRQLSRLKRDFELESNSLSLILVFLERIRKLEKQLHHQLHHLDNSNLE